jgi:hypothetical protein
MRNVIISEIVPDVNMLKDSLAKELPSAYKTKTPSLNRKAIRVVKSLRIVSEVHVRSNKIIIHNAMPLYLALATLFCLPSAFYLLCKFKDGESLRTSVHDIVLRATQGT